ncbi:MAG: FAD-dependent oxidoreductase [Chlorobiaceae bacterium]|nr:FAD-dependent oxidoreductase [Chlorobiaceae bacterium]
MSRVAVIGGGISGIATAFHLNQKGVNVDLIEKDDQLGGRIGSASLDGRWLDFGGKNIGKKYYRFRRFIDVLGDLEYEYFGFNSSQLVNGRVISINKDSASWYQMVQFLELSGLQGVVRLLPMARAILKNQNEGFLNSDFFNSLSERSDHLSLSEFFNARCVNHVIRPVTVRMNGAEADECYPGNFGSNLSLLLDSYEQLTESMHRMLELFEERSTLTRVLCGHTVQSIEKKGDAGPYVLTYSLNNETYKTEYDRIVTALPASQLWPLLGKLCPDSVSLLQQVRYYPVAIVIARYQKNVFLKDQRAMVFDHTFPLSNAGAYGTTDLDLVRYTFSGRESRKIISEEMPPDDIASMGERIIAPYFSVKGNKRESFLYKRIASGLCAYSAYHHRLLEQLDRLFDPSNGLVLTGDYWRGASIEACFSASFEAVEKLLKRESA